ncbi:nitroreductase family protein [Hydrogenophaga sp.]|uniref:nitroreductase family protein n=1 Tax=Hydrogenophaga sp. TaxID=1904254 RepID=UPI003F6F1EBE
MHDPRHHTDPLAGLLGRYSVGTRHLAEPAPSLDELRRMAAAALRAPDHAGLVPFRFAAIRGDARERLAGLFEQAALLAGKGAEDAALDRRRALDAPLLVAVIARIDPGHPVATLHEQWMAVGGALTNFMNAAHLLGYAGKMLSGSKVRAAPVLAAFCEPGEQLVGWVVMGTAQRPGTPKFQKPGPDALMRDWP